MVPAGGGADTADLAAYVNERVPYYERLERVVLVDAIPRSATGKVVRRQVRDELISANGR